MPHRLLHREQRHNLQQVVLYDITDDAVLVKVAATPLCAEVFTEYDLQNVEHSRNSSKRVLRMAPWLWRATPGMWLPCISMTCAGSLASKKRSAAMVRVLGA